MSLAVTPSSLPIRRKIDELHQLQTQAAIEKQRVFVSLNCSILFIAASIFCSYYFIPLAVILSTYSVRKLFLSSYQTVLAHMIGEELLTWIDDQTINPPTDETPFTLSPNTFLLDCPLESEDRERRLLLLRGAMEMETTAKAVACLVQKTNQDPYQPLPHSRSFGDQTIIAIPADLIGLNSDNWKEFYTPFFTAALTKARDLGIRTISLPASSGVPIEIKPQKFLFFTKQLLTTQFAGSFDEVHLIYSEKITLTP